jgi:hypothetical protein
MKKTLTIFALLAGAVGVYAQGEIYFADYTPATAGANQEFEITIWGPQSGDSTVALSGNGPANANNTFASAASPGNLPGGTQTGYTGTAIGGASTGSGPTAYANGNNYSVQLYAAPGAGDAASSLVPVTGAVSTFYTFGGTANEGQFSAGNDVALSAANMPGAASGIAYGGTGTFALAAWYNGGGTISYAQASTPGSGDPSGMSVPVTITLGANDAAPVSLNPMTSFNMTTTTTPEPSTIALGLIGACSFLLRRRKA